MTDLKTLVEHEMEHAGAPVFGIGDVRARRERMRRNQRIGAGVIAIAIAIAVAWLGADVIRAEHTVPANPPVPSPLPTPTVAESGWSPVVERGPSVVDGHNGHAWSDRSRDTSKPWVDIEKVQFNRVNAGSWSISLRADPPRAVRPGYRWIISYGVVLDTTGDGVADYLIGLNNDAPKNGDFHAWVTNLATGETDDQVGGPYGFPIDFAHPIEAGVDGRVTLTFLSGSQPADMDPDTMRFYAWASETLGETVIANDYAPDAGWATLRSVASPLPSHTPTVAKSTWSPVVERDSSVVFGRHGVPHVGTSGGTTWFDPRDASIPWIDIEKLTFTHGDGAQWALELPADPHVHTSGPGRITSYGLVLDTNGDGVADYLAGLNNEGPNNDDVHTWVTDLATGKTDEQFGAPYGFPVEFSFSPVERGTNGYILLTFLSDPAGLDEDTVRFYAWASETQGETVIATDYAPDTGWMSPG